MHPPPLPLPPIYPLDVSLSLSLSTTDIGVNVGLSGNRPVVCLVFCEHRSMRHMILELQRRLSPEFDDKDIKFAHETNAEDACLCCRSWTQGWCCSSSTDI